MKLINKDKINIVGKRTVFFIIALVFILASVVSFIVKGFNLDTDFVGGTTFEFTLDKDATDDDIKTVEDTIRSTVDVSGNINMQVSNGNVIIAKIADLSSDSTADIKSAVSEKLGISEETVNTDFIGGVIAGETTRSLIIAVTIAILLMLLYITIRFKITTGLSAIICLAHDVIIVLGFYSIFSIPVNSTLIACLLTILGYSINATIIIFDRVRENVKREPKTPYSQIVNTSVTQTLNRSINTTITTFLTIGMIYILGSASIKEFALPIMVGLLAGLFSSVFLAGSISTLFVKDKAKA
ncbi:MAG: protein translocase subunit SecF [Firmicutes bacterium]|nr:protein translocase subunit SecF [Bacillota bacterium]